ncbi:Universal stress protein UspA [Flavobacterium psychrophilum]|uniref:universal stress protein n=1 Tax=Flavobacterium psychrophilum TaxID=96345 RepID=UPI000B7C1FF0|nr:universal stress protein [Flavobacterium psychrophilum]EKT4551795.1 universal stress protein [Flavobacterium psychrophilum]SNB30151.1 Universal stress protein UspA [Flavobacterium psychrophilum]
MKRILVPTDFSKNAEHALKVAAQIAKKNNSEILLVHMLELPQQNSDAVSQGREIPEVMFFKNAVLQKLEDLMAQDYLSEIAVSEIIQFELAFDGILKISKAHDIDLVVMGSHGASGFKEMFVGSNAEKVVRNSEIPVLIIKEEDNDFAITNFVFASDFSDEIKKPFQEVVNFANNFGAKLHLVTINTPNQFVSTSTAEEKMANFVSNFKINDFQTHIYNETSVEKGILKFSNSVKADLIGISTHGRKGLAHFFNGSLAEGIVNHATKPIITFKI